MKTMPAGLKAALRANRDALHAKESLNKIKTQEIHLTLTLGEVDALVNAGRYAFQHPKQVMADSYLVYALQKLDAAVNL